MNQETIDLVTYLAAGTILLSPFLLKRFQNLANLTNTVVSLGILGTFTGIFFGLMKFDVSNIADSVPLLLAGLKTAFLTSIAGISTSILLKSFPIAYGIRVPKQDTKQEQAAIATMVQQLIKLNASIAGDGETSVVTQIQKLRATNSDKLDDLNRSFDDFAEKMVSDSTQSLIDALNQVLADFNTKINEQFGENFKHLNEGVGKMLDWQKEYSSQVETMTGQYQMALRGLSESEKKLENIASLAIIYNETAESLEKLLRNLNTTLVGIDEVGKNVKHVFPEIEKQIHNLTSGFSESVSDSLSEIKRLHELQRQSMKGQIDVLTNSQQQLDASSRRLVSDLSTQIERMMEENSTRIAKQLTNLDEQLAEELNKSLESLGSQLTSLSAKFVEDYTPLTNELRRLVVLAKEIQKE